VAAPLTVQLTRIEHLKIPPAAPVEHRLSIFTLQVDTDVLTAAEAAERIILQYPRPSGAGFEVAR